MLGIEALHHLKDGKKIRMIKWPPEAYIVYEYNYVHCSPALNWYYFFNVNSPQECQYKFQQIFHDFLTDQWEIVDE